MKVNYPMNKATEQLQLEMELDNMRGNLPYMIQLVQHNAKLSKAKYDALLEEGFTEEQALKIVVSQKLLET